MPLVTYGQYLKGVSESVSDQEIKDLIQEVQQQLSPRWEVKETIIKATLFRKGTTFYELFADINGVEWQCINFMAKDNDSDSLNYRVDRSTLSAYLWGLLAGAKEQRDNDRALVKS